MQNIRRDDLPNGIRVLTFDRPDSTANIFDQRTLLELDAQLSDLAGVSGIIFLSSKPAIFVAGADLRAVREMNADDLNRFIFSGQDIFNRVSALKIPTVAAIHGACVGGGCELVLACDWRAASDDRNTKIGLPETKLGIVPAWGGCTRLPRLLGVPAALDIILGGKTLSARHAKKVGLVDEVAPRESLLAAGIELISRGKHPHSFSHSAAVNAMVDAVVARKARRDVQERTRGNYPAVAKALEVILRGSATWTEAESLGLERAAIGELIQLESTKELMRLFFLQERAKKISVPVEGEQARPKKLANAAVIGAGVMGAGIAHWLSSRGMRVVLRDIDTTRVAAGMSTIAKLYANGVKHHATTEVEARAGMDRVSPAPAEVPLQRMDIVIEAAVERMDIKKTVFQRLDDITSPSTLLATNTSALSITELAAATRHPERVVGIHFFNPVLKMQLVEVVRGEHTSAASLQKAVQFVQQIGKLPVIVRDSAGFLVNRILVPYMVEAGEMFASGVDVEAIDNAMLDFGMPMGPLRLIDEVGLDVAAEVSSTLAAAFPARMHVPEILQAMLKEGFVGKKAKQGFYRYDSGGEAHPNGAALALRKSHATPAHIAERLALLMVNEAASTLEQGVAETAADIDFAMVMGTGWAPFRGGPLRYADHLGIAQVVERLTALGKGSPAFTPTPLLVEMSKTGKRFYED